MSASSPRRPGFWAFSSLVAGAFGLVVASGTARAATYADDFAGGIDSTYWNTVITTPNLYSIDATQGDVRFAKNAAVTSPGGFQNVRIGLKLAAVGGPVSGDFATEVLFRDADIRGPVFNQVQFESFYADGSSFLNVFDNYGSPAIGINVHVWDGANIRGARALPADTTTGTLRIARVGTALTAYFNDLTIYTANKTSGLTGVRLSLQNNHNNDTIAVTYDDFSLTGASVVPEPTSLTAFASLAGLAVVRRRR